MNLCTTCGLDFGSEHAFDRHRVGEFIQNVPECWSGEYVDRLRAGFCPNDDWKPEYGRRCLDEEELKRDPAFAQNHFGRWSLARDLERGKKLRRAKGRAAKKAKK